jgi:hypothetical protein
MMNLLSTTISRSMEALPWTPDAIFSDVGDLLPLLAVCFASILCTALWLLAVSSYVSKERVHVIR